MKAGQSIGLTDSLMRDIHVGDLIQDATGARYSIDRYGRAKPLHGGNEVPVKNLEGVEVLDPVQITPPHTDPEKEAVDQIHAAIKDAGDQTLVDELRLRGWTVICSKKVEKVVFETVEI